MVESAACRLFGKISRFAKYDFDAQFLISVGLTGDISTLSSMITSTQSAEEAKQSSILTFVALIFAPMTLVSNVLAMSGGFAPGGHLFGWYFGISVPLTLLVFLMVMIVRVKNAHDENSSVRKLGAMFSTRGGNLDRKLDPDLEKGNIDVEQAQARYKN